MIGGLKATLHSRCPVWLLKPLLLTHLTTLTDPNTGEEAKQRAKAKLEEHGVEVV